MSQLFSIKKCIIGKKLVVGENTEKSTLGYPISTHAEIDAVNKLLASKICKKKKIVKVNLLVIRLSKTKSLGSSRPCFHCLNFLERNRQINIKYVYYSNAKGEIVREKFDDMKKSNETYVSTGFRRWKKKKL